MKSYCSPWWLRGGHAQTIYAKCCQPDALSYRRELHLDRTSATSVAYDFVDGDDGSPLVVLFLGLEGSSRSHYALALMTAVRAQGWHGVVVHYRGCGGVDNRAPIAYHAGDDAEADHVLRYLVTRFACVYAVGVSLGGNVLAKYLGTLGHAAIPRAAAILSAPLDLAQSAQAMNERWSNTIYHYYFLRSLLPKAHAMAARHAQINVGPSWRCRRLSDFDEAFTAPVHGFYDAADYYQCSSAKPLLGSIARPTWIVNALNDPIVPKASLPTREEVSEHVRLYQPTHGGHVGFVTSGGLGCIDWLPQQVLRFFLTQE